MSRRHPVLSRSCAVLILTEGNQLGGFTSSEFARTPDASTVHDMLVHGARKKIDKKLRSELN